MLGRPTISVVTRTDFLYIDRDKTESTVNLQW